MATTSKIFLMSQYSSGFIAFLVLTSVSVNTKRNNTCILLKDLASKQDAGKSVGYRNVIKITLCYKSVKSPKPILSFQQAPAVLLLPQYNWAPLRSKLMLPEGPNPAVHFRAKTCNMPTLKAQQQVFSVDKEEAVPATSVRESEY